MEDGGVLLERSNRTMSDYNFILNELEAFRGFFFLKYWHDLIYGFRNYSRFLQKINYKRQSGSRETCFGSGFGP